MKKSGRQSLPSMRKWYKHWHPLILPSSSLLKLFLLHLLHYISFLPLISFSSDRDCDSLDTLIHIARRKRGEKEREEEKRMRKKDLLWKKSVFLLFDRILFPLIPTHWWFFSFFLSFTLAFILSQSPSSFLSPGCRSFPDFAHSLVPFLPLDFFLLYFILSLPHSFSFLFLQHTKWMLELTNYTHSLPHSLTQSLNFSLRVRLRELSPLSLSYKRHQLSQSVSERRSWEKKETEVKKNQERNQVRGKKSGKKALTSCFSSLREQVFSSQKLILPSFSHSSQFFLLLSCSIYCLPFL